MLNKINITNKLVRNRKKAAFTLAIVILCVFLITQYLGKLNYKNQLVREKAIPHIELSNVQFEHNDRYFVNVKGFVAFADIEDQPKNLRQYYEIDTDINADRVRVFYLDEIIAIHPLPPKEFGRIRLYIVSENNSELVLRDETGNKFFIDKSAEKVTVLDAAGNKTYLIANDSEYRAFIKKLLR